MVAVLVVKVSGLVGSTEGFRDSRRCSRDTYPESYITEHTYYMEMILSFSLKCSLAQVLAMLGGGALHASTG
jgi:hypothetical protein